VIADVNEVTTVPVESSTAMTGWVMKSVPETPGEG
jgi:hypothetical protein